MQYIYCIALQPCAVQYLPKTSPCFSARATTFCALASTNHKGLVKWVVAGTPVGQDQAETDSLENTGKSADGDRIEGALLCEDLRDELERRSALSLAEISIAVDGLTLGAELAMKIKLPRYAAPL